MENLVFLIDSNVFLEALLKQEQFIKAQQFLESNKPSSLYVTDFTLHSIALLLLKNKKATLLETFINEVIIDRIQVLSIETNNLITVIENARKFNTDFDDAYQYTVAKKYKLAVVTFDKDFDKTDIKRIEP